MSVLRGDADESGAGTPLRGRRISGKNEYLDATKDRSFGMFPKFARFISRHWIWVLAAWVVVPLLLHIVAPKWDEITHDGDFAYLPPTMTSVRGEELFEKAFPDLASKSSVVLVVARSDGRLTEADLKIAGDLADEFTPKPGEKSPVTSVMRYNPDDVVGQKLKSRSAPTAGTAKPC